MGASKPGASTASNYYQNKQKQQQQQQQHASNSLAQFRVTQFNPLAQEPLKAAASAQQQGDSADVQPASSSGSSPPAELSLELPSSSSHGQWEDLVHEVCWRVGRRFGFQAFNLNPGSKGFKRQQYVPATMFVASDHLAALLVRSTYLRDKVSPSDDVRFARAVWELHSNIFLNYEARWCPTLKLSTRPRTLQDKLAAEFCDPVVVHGLLCELSLYFLMYSEGANLRHMPEALWFFYWAAAHSRTMEQLWGLGMPQPVQLARDRRVALRNMLQSEIAALQQQFQHQPAGLRAEECLRSLDFMQGKVPTGGLSGPDVDMYLDLIAFGDGSFFCDRVITPVFYVLSYEMDHLFLSGEEVTFRLGYDDVNESLTNSTIVHNTLKLLGVSGEAVRAAEVNGAYLAITRLGCPQPITPAMEAGNPTAAAESDAAFDAARAAAFWSEHVFVKTYRERRSWLAIYRAFYRVYVVHLVMIHVLTAHAFAPFDMRVISSAVITHAGCSALERLANWWMCRPQQDPLDDKARQEGWLEGKDCSSKKQASSKEAAAEAGSAGRDAGTSSTASGLAGAHARRGSIKVEGAPLWGFFGCFEWVLLFVGITTFYACQFMGPMMAMARSFWLFVAGGYVVVVLVHGCLTTRDGYCISLSHALRLPALFTSSSSRPRATYWLDGNMRTGWANFWLTALFWVQCLVLKAVFDFYVILRPMTGPILLLLEQHRFLPCSSSHYSLLGKELPIPCIGGDWLLILVRTVPFLLICIMDTHIFYQITLLSWGLVRGLFVLNVGVVGDWDALIREFHRGPLRWWDKCMSARGNRNRRSLVGYCRAHACCSEDGSGAGYASGSECSSSSSSSSSHEAPALSGMGSALPPPPSPATILRSLADSAASRSADGSVKSGLSKASSSSSLGSLKRGKRSASKAAQMLGGQTDDHLAMWDAFAAAWDAVVEDLREGDLISNTERDHLRFHRLNYGRGLEVTGVRPILLPAFFYAGAIQRCVDSGLVSPQQELVLAELRCLAVWLGCQLGVLGVEAAQALMRVRLCRDVVDLVHSSSRERMMRAGVRLLTALGQLGARMETPADLHRRQGSHNEACAALVELYRCLEVECQAVKKAAASKRGSSIGSKDKCNMFEQQDVEAAQALLEMCQGLRTQLQQDPSSLSSCLRVLHDESMEEASSSSSSSSSEGSGAGMVQKVVAVMLRMLTVTPAAARPASKEAQQVLEFFMSSLANKQLAKAAPLDEMLSWTVLTPCYEEDVLYPLDAKAFAAHMGAPAGGAKHLTDLLTETEDKVSLVSYLRSVFPKDWEHFKERLGEQLATDLSHITEADFAAGGPLAQLGLQLQLWASFRGQLLARTVRGMMCADRALRVLAHMEQPCPPGMERREYEQWVDQLVSSKFNYVVSAQVYGRCRGTREVRGRWLAEGVDTLLEVYGRLQVAFLDSAASERGPSQYSVLIRGKRCVQEWDAQEYMAGQRVEEVYRVRLPHNRYTARGVIIGEGKPENQNHAVIFCFGEALQTIDMNQDNHVCEALKMRNLLGELLPECRAGASPRQALDSQVSGVQRMSAQAYSSALAGVRAAEQPVALVGFREHIFSDKSGALGSFAASAEFAFGTMVQRVMDTPGRVRMHYGHPDVFNKVYAMTRGGVSKATRQLHISEDIFGGYNHTLRGGRIKYREYISVGKGRDMGFDSINAFEIKISGGAGEVLISRDLWRLATRMDLWRCMHFYFSGCGYYVNTWILMATVYAQIFALVFFALARASSVILPYTFQPGDAGYDWLNPTRVAGYNVQDTLREEYVLQLGTLSILPYVAELVLEQGLLRSLITCVHQILAGSFGFWVFKQQTTAAFFQDDMAFGGAQYIGTGRGFSITTASFIKLFTNYARTHLYPGFDILYLCILLAIVQDCADCNYSALTWGAWLVGGSLVLAPFWFNPLTFSPSKVKRDFAAWRQWLNGEVDPETGTTWHAWNRKQLEKVRNDRRNQTSHWGNVLGALAVQCLPLALLTLAAVSRLDLQVAGGPALLQSSYVIFALATALIWAALATTLHLHDRFQAAARQRSWRLYSFLTAVAAGGLLVVYLAVLMRWYSGSGISNLLIILYANGNLLAMAHRAATQLATRSPRTRALVDRGFLLTDMFVGTVVLLLLGAMSFVGVFAWLQHNLLFNINFARSIRRGQLVKTIGPVKADAQAQLLQQQRAAAVESALQGARSRAGSMASLSAGLSRHRPMV